MARSVVVLPQPDGPSSTTNSLSSIVEVEVADDVDGAEVLLDVAKLDLRSCSAFDPAVGCVAASILDEDR